MAHQLLKALQILSLLYSEVSDDDVREKLESRYFDLIKKTDSFGIIEGIIQNSVSYSPRGEQLIKESNAIRETVANDIENGIKELREIDLVIRDINEEFNRSNTEMSGILPRMERINLLNKQDERLYTMFYDALTEGLAFLLIKGRGPRAIEDIDYDKKRNSLQYKMRIVNELLIPRFATHKEKLGWWAIRKQEYNILNYFSYSGFSIGFLNGSLKEVESLPITKISEYLYAFPYMEDGMSDYLLIGYGNIVGKGIFDSTEMLEGNVKTNLERSDIENWSINQYTLIDDLKTILKTDKFCISPEQLVNLLNESLISKLVQNRRNEGKCVLCGKQTSGYSIYCGNHFTINT